MPLVTAPHQYDPESSLQMAVTWSSGDALQFERMTPWSLKKTKRSRTSGRSRGSCVLQLRFTEFPSVGWESVTFSFGRENSSDWREEVNQVLSMRQAWILGSGKLQTPSKTNLLTPLSHFSFPGLFKSNCSTFSAS